MRNVYLVQINSTYGRNAFLPYSVGLLQAYAQTIEEINLNYDFKGFIYFRDDIDKLVNGLQTPDVVGISCYIWNWHFSIALAKAIKQAYPNCLMVLGGPHVPVASAGFFVDHPYADLLAHYEGEISFSDILLARLHASDYSAIPGLSVKLEDQTAHKTALRERTSDLSILPSPYLNGVFDKIIAEDYDFHASQETNRGCPYECTFCDWGSNIMAKLKLFDTSRLLEEFDWFAQHKIEMVYNCDANYGIVKRDIELTEYMTNLKKTTGYPQKFRAAYAKNSNDTVYTIANLLHESGMNKGITLSFQSMNDSTLQLIKRRNIKITDFSNIISKYRSKGIATYSEIIIGLPGETYDTFADGLDLLIRSGQHDSIQVYTCEMLPNSEMSNPSYKALHQLKTVRTPVLFFHGTPQHDPHQEFYELVVGTATLSADDWLKCQMLSWAIQAFHCLSLTQSIALFFVQHCGYTYRTFYEHLLKLASLEPNSVLGKVAIQAKTTFENLKSGQNWGSVDQRFGNIIWPPEEFTYLTTITQIRKFYTELYQQLEYLIDSDKRPILKDVIDYQEAVVWSFSPATTIHISLKHNVHEVLEAAYINQTCPFETGTYPYRIIPAKSFDDLPTYAREVVWYGRKGGRFRHTDVQSQRQPTS